jgi:hypothetical protein
MRPPAACYVYPALEGESLQASADAIPADKGAERGPWIAEVYPVCAGARPAEGAWLAEAWAKEQDDEIWYY